jgi:hypothetical protein
LRLEQEYVSFGWLNERLRNLICDVDALIPT